MKEESREKNKEGLDTQRGGIRKVIKILAYVASYIFGAGVLICIWFAGEEDLAKFLGYLIGGGLLIWQISLSNRRATSAEKTADAMQEATRLNAGSNIAERFKSSVEHLSDKSMSIKLGGIYVLNQLAQNAPEYRAPIFDIFCTYIRETTSGEKYMSSPPTKEIQSILNLLFIEEEDRETYKDLPANLRGSYLRKAILENACLENANLEYVELMSSTLRKANFTNANLNKTDFQNADLSEANLANARHLEFDQLAAAEILNGAKLPDGMEEKIRDKRPGLLEKPNNKQKI